MVHDVMFGGHDEATGGWNIFPQLKINMVFCNFFLFSFIFILFAFTHVFIYFIFAFFPLFTYPDQMEQTQTEQTHVCIYTSIMDGCREFEE